MGHNGAPPPTATGLNPVPMTAGKKSKNNATDATEPETPTAKAAGVFSCPD